MRWRASFIGVVVFELSFAVILQSFPAYANHETINIVLDRPPTASIQQGERVSTFIEISTGNFTAHGSGDSAEVMYDVTFNDTRLSEPHIPSRVETIRLFVPEFDSVRYDYSRAFVEGFWQLDVHVRDALSGQLLQQSSLTINVQPSTAAIVERQLSLQEAQIQLFQRQVTADETNANAAIVTAVVSPAAAVLAAFLAGKWAYSAGKKVEEMRQDADIKKEQTFAGSIRHLIRHELTEYKDWLTLLLSESTEIDKTKLHLKHDCFVTEKSPKWNEIFHFKGHWPRQYPHLPVEHRIRALHPQTMQDIDDAIRGFQTFLESYLDQDGFAEGEVFFNRLHFDKEDVTKTQYKIDAALTSLSALRQPMD